ncbi:MAG: hypothetical protein OEZ33_10065 [Gammaproteobacteria bacterium]|nr:hypothetical protein [Gammaproteobacteria bacterium]MDH5778547.1 hypothetical protein [Gammaproteobacteria bacterium]
MQSRILKGLLLFLLVSTGSVVADSEYIKSDKIHINFGDPGNSAAYVADHPKQFYLEIKTDIKNVSEIEIRDVSKKGFRCPRDFLESPMHVATFKADPSRNLSEVGLRIDLPCASFHKEWDLLVRVKSQQGKYYIKKRMPVSVSLESPGY